MSANAPLRCEVQSLLPHHKRELEASGITEETRVAAGIYSETDHFKNASLLNRKKWPQKYGTALVFPYLDENGTAVQYRLKPDNPPTKNGKVSGKYLSPSGSSVRAYFPPGVYNILAEEARRTIFITEGEKKALALNQVEFAAIGLPGVDCWHGKKTSALLPELERINWKHRKVYIVFDADAAMKERVKQNECLLAMHLKNRGADVRVVRLPGPEKGVDDLLVTQGINAFLDLVNAAEESDQPAAEDLKCDISGMRPEEEAARFMEAHEKDGICRLRYWRDTWWYWKAGCYREFSESEVRSKVTRNLNNSYYRVGNAAVNNVMGQLEAQSILADRAEPPSWLGDCPGSDWDTAQLLIARNAIVYLPTLEMVAPTPHLFSTVAADFDFVPGDECPSPETWMGFLASLWPDDPEAIEALQLWFGYCITADTRQQKLLALFGPKRSGKGTIVRVLRALVGEANTAAPILASFSQPFGLSPLIGKTLAVIPDARLSGRFDNAVVIERLLSITGEDALTIDRKFLKPITCKLSARLMLVSNEIPRLADASGALAGRMIVLKLTRSWYEQEDLKLTDRLLAELPGILWWAIAGWQKLQKTGRLLQPVSGTATLEEMEDISSPVGVFVRECCVVDPNQEVSRSELYTSYVEWAKDNGRDHIEDSAGFGRNLHASLPSLQTFRPRVDGKQIRHFRGIGLSLR